MIDESIYQAARDAFNAYAGLGVPALPASHWSALQVRLARWQNLHFPRGGSLKDMALGVAEELGELGDVLVAFAALASSTGRLCHAVLKNGQDIRGLGGTEALRVAGANAIADTQIFATQLCTLLRIDFGTLYELTAESILQRDWNRERKKQP